MAAGRCHRRFANTARIVPVGPHRSDFYPFSGVYLTHPGGAPTYGGRDPAHLIPARGAKRVSGASRTFLLPAWGSDRPQHFAAAAHPWAAMKGRNNKDP